MFSNLSQIIGVLAPGFKNIDPSLENLLKLVCRIKRSMETNSIHFADKTLIFFDYFLSANNQIKFEIQNNKILISNEEKFMLGPFESRDLNFRFICIFAPNLGAKTIC